MSLLQQAQQEPDVRRQIAVYLEKKGIMKTFLARKIGVSAQHLGFILVCERVLTDDLLNKINITLETNFEKTPEQKIRIAG